MLNTKYLFLMPYLQQGLFPLRRECPIRSREKNENSALDFLLHHSDPFHHRIGNIFDNRIIREPVVA